MSNKKVRLDYLDIAKAIAIYIVVLGHALPNDVWPYYRLVIYSFHMPLFFMVSGIVVRRHQHEYNKEHWLNFFRKNLIALIIPYIIWAIIYTSLKYNLLGYIFYGSWEALTAIDTLTSLWFLPALFVARTLMELVLMISTRFEKIDRHVFAFAVGIIALIIGANLPTLELGYPWCFNCAVTALSFMLFGYSAKEFMSNKPLKFFVIELIVFVAIFLGYLIYIGEDLQLVRMFDNNISDYLSFIVMALSGSGMILALSRIISYFWKDKDTKLKRFVLWVGRSSIGIFLIHKPFMLEVVSPFLESLGFNPTGFPAALIGSIIAFAYSCIVVKVIGRYIPQLFGKFNNEKTLVIKEEE